jgi:hypothetical protein
MAGASLTRKWAASLARNFATWLHAREPDKPNLVKVYRSHHPFFERLDAQFVLQSEATAEAILQFFGTAMLRRHLLASRFLAEELKIVFADQLKSDASERDRIDDKLCQCRKQSWGDTIDRYYKWLSDANLPLRTIRLYLSTAVSFCEIAKVKNEAWPASVLQQFLQKQPGLRNNLSKFVGYCRKAYGWEVEMPRRPPKQASDNDNGKLILEMRKLMRQTARQGIREVDLKVLEKIIAKSLAFRIGDVARASRDQFIEQGGKWFFQNGDEIVAIPVELEPYFREYTNRRLETVSF